MKYAVFTLLAVALATGSFATVYRYGLEVHTHLPPLSLVCANPEAYQEAQEALAVHDQAGATSVSACFFTTFPMEARAFECGWSTCRVRLIYPNKTSQPAYIGRGRLTS